MTIYTVTTDNGKVYNATSNLTDQEAALAIREGNNQGANATVLSDFARQWGPSILSEEQRSWLHVFAAWASCTRPMSRSPSTEDSFARLAEMFRVAEESQPQVPFILLEGFGSCSVLLRRALRGHINVTSGGPMSERIWFGRIEHDGNFGRGPACTDEHVALLRRLNEEPEQVIAQHGARNGYCAMCGTALAMRTDCDRGYHELCGAPFGLNDRQHGG